MRMLWWIPITVLAVGAGLLMRRRRRRADDTALTTDPVSSEWLAEARGRDEHHW
jgi:cytochrome c-type biogenesis protein CcmH/NrfF